MTKIINEKAAEVQKAIKAKEAEIAAILKEEEAAVDNAVELVAAEKKERRARSELAALKAAYKAVTYIPPEPTDQQELLAGLEKYQEIWDNRVNTIRAKIVEVNTEIIEIGNALEQAAEAADTEKTIELSNRRNECKEAREHLIEMLQRAEEIPLYPEGAIQSKWEEICEKVRPEWDNKIMNLKIITAAYKEAANSLLQMEFTIKSVRNFLEKKQGGERLNSSFTFYENGDDMTIEGTYNARIKGICNPLTSHDTI